MKLFETIESKWEHHCDAGMPELLNYLANDGEEVVTTKRKLYDEVNRRCPYPGVVISDRTIKKNLDLLVSLKIITIETTGGKLGSTIIRRGTGRGSQKKTCEIDFELLQKWYNDNIAKAGRPQWLKITKKEKENIRKCQRIANERQSTIGTAMKKFTESTFLMSSKQLGHYWIFMEDNFIKILEGNYDNGQRNNGTTEPRIYGVAKAEPTDADIKKESDQRLRDQINSIRQKQGGQGRR